MNKKQKLNNIKNEILEEVNEEEFGVPFRKFVGKSNDFFVESTTKDSSNDKTSDKTSDKTKDSIDFISEDAETIEVTNKETNATYFITKKYYDNNKDKYTVKTEQNTEQSLLALKNGVKNVSLQNVNNHMNKNYQKLKKKFDQKKFQQLTSSCASYTRGYYYNLNKLLREDNVDGMSQKQKLLLNQIDQLLQQCQSYEGPVLRVLDVQNQKQFLKSFKPGSIVGNLAYTSTTATLHQKQINHLIQSFVQNKPAVMLINSKNGKGISKFSSIQIQKQILFKRNAKFRVLDLEQTKDKIKIYLEEV